MWALPDAMKRRLRDGLLPGLPGTSVNSASIDSNLPAESRLSFSRMIGLLFLVIVSLPSLRNATYPIGESRTKAQMREACYSRRIFGAAVTFPDAENRLLQGLFRPGRRFDAPSLPHNSSTIDFRWEAAPVVSLSNSIRFLFLAMGLNPAVFLCLRL